MATDKALVSFIGTMSYCKGTWHTAMCYWIRLASHQTALQRQTFGKNHVWKKVIKGVATPVKSIFDNMNSYLTTNQRKINTCTK